MKQRVTALLLCAALLLSLAGCAAASAKSTDLMEGITPAAAGSGEGLSGGEPAAAARFGLELLRHSMTGEDNVLVAPMSVLCALAMAANGAEGEALAQLEAAFGTELPRLNEGLSLWLSGLPQSGKGRLSMANAIWIRDTQTFTPDPAFLQTNADFYGAGAFLAPFDGDTCRDINRWVKEHTDGMIPQLVDSIPPEAVLYLVNALSFEGEWRDIYRDTQVQERRFTTASGEKRTVDMMLREEHLWLETDTATGFMKPYGDGRFAFAALLPREGITLRECAASLTGASLTALFTHPVRTPVKTGLPKFSAEYSADLRDVLRSMGVEQVFDGGGLSRIGSSSEGPLLISRVLHRTFITVDEKGTKAGAATAVEVAPGAAPPGEEPKSVILDRPFLYFIVDTRLGLPVFAGAMNAP